MRQMTQAILCINILCLLLAGCRRHSDVEGSVAQFAEQNHPRPRECAFGHRELKEIPIVYGLLAYDEEQEKKFENKELWKGGCILRSETTKLYCPNCEYAYQDGLDCWERFSGNTNDFRIQLDPLIANFPGKGSYLRDLKGNEVIRESCLYWAKGDANALNQEFIEYLESFELSPVTNAQHFNARVYYHIFSKYKDRYVKVEIMTDGTTDDVHVRVDLLHRDQIGSEFMLKSALNIDGYEWEPSPAVDYKHAMSESSSSSRSHDNKTEHTTVDDKFTYHIVSEYVQKKNGGKEYEVTYAKKDLNGTLVFRDKKTITYRNQETTLWEDSSVAIRFR